MLNGAPSTTQDIDIEREIDTRGWVSGVLIVRLQAKTSWASGTALTVIARRVSVVKDGTSTLFPGGTLAFAQFLATATAPQLEVAAFNLPITCMAAITVRLTQPALTSATSAELGIELVGRTASRLASGAKLASVIRPRSGIVENQTAVIYREPWGARPIPWKVGNNAASDEATHGPTRSLRDGSTARPVSPEYNDLVSSGPDGVYDQNLG